MPALRRLRALFCCPKFRCRAGWLADGCVWLLGPILICAAVVLVGGSIIVFFNSILPFHYASADNTTTTLTAVSYYAHFAWAVYLAVMVSFHYYTTIRTSPGHPKRVDISRFGYPTAGLNPPALSSPVPTPSLPVQSNSIHAANQYPSNRILQSSSVSGPTAAPAAISINMPEKEPIILKVCSKCYLPKYERTHHCSICNHCVLRMDHHCPWVNNCVGHFNHRYFYLFLFYLWIGCIYYVLMAKAPFYSCFDSQDQRLSNKQRQYVVLYFMLSSVLCIALGLMWAWHTYLVLSNQTTIEFYKNKLAKLIAREQGQSYFNEFDLGSRTNVRLFFNVNSHWPWWYAFLPLKVPPHTDGTDYPTLKSYNSINFGPKKQ